MKQRRLRTSTLRRAAFIETHLSEAQKSKISATLKNQKLSEQALNSLMEVIERETLPDLVRSHFPHAHTGEVRESLKSMRIHIDAILAKLVSLEDGHHFNKLIDQYASDEEGNLDALLMELATKSTSQLSGTEIILRKIDWALEDYLAELGPGESGRPKSSYNQLILALSKFFDDHLPGLKVGDSPGTVFVKLVDCVFQEVLKTPTGDSRGAIRSALKCRI